MKKIIYTVNIGGYDELRSPLFIDEGVDYYCITDHAAMPPHPWIKIPLTDIVRHTTKDAHLQQRFQKIAGIPELHADITLYHDANLVQQASFLPLFDRLITSGADMLAMTHPDRDCVYEEIAACIQYKKAPEDLLRAQAVAYRNMGMPAHNGLIASGLLVRYTSRKTWKIDRTWWINTEAYSHRDQISFALTDWQLGIKKELLPWEEAFSRYIVRTPHTIKKEY